MDFLSSKGYIKEGTTDVLNVEKLTGGKQALGNGTDTDIYKIEEQDGKYIVNYYDKNGTPKEIWNVAKGTETGSVTLEPDTGKEALILVYNVSAGDTIELPYKLTWYDSEGNQYDATFDFTVDWGDGNTDTITNTDIETKAIHQYTETKEIKITITGTYEVLSSGSYPKPSGIDKLIKIEQWGTTEIENIELTYLDDLIEIAEPTESSFEYLIKISFGYSGIRSIPENLFANCPNVTTFDGTFAMTNITNIPKNLFANCLNVTDFSSCFSGCENLTGEAPKLWLRVPNGEENEYKGIPNGNFCFEGCFNLDNYDEIPPYWRDKGIPT